MSLLRATLAPALLSFALALPAWATPGAADLARTLKLAEVTEILKLEGQSYADSIERDMLPGGGGQLWDELVTQLYDPALMQAALETALGQGMGPEDIAEADGFFGSDEGQSILTYENAARQAMADSDVEDLARATYAELREDGSARLEQIDRFVAANDLMERNVAGALSSNYQFLRGFADGGAIEMSDGDIISDVWSQEEEIRADTESWLYAFLLMAYQPLDDDVMERYIAFSETDGGQALNAALFEGFEDLYREISYTLGLAAARAMAGSDL